VTTIAFRDGVMAADSMECDDAQKWQCVKLFRARAAVIGLAGDSVNSLIFLDWYRDRKNPAPERDTDHSFEALVASAAKLELWTELLRPQIISADYYAIGSGASVALGCMYGGSDAYTAVEAACHFARGSREPVIAKSIRPERDVVYEPAAAIKLAVRGAKTRKS